MSGFFWASKYIFKQKRRTLLTVFGIALAIALVCGTGVLANSFRELFKESAIRSNGNWHYEIRGISDRSLADTLIANRAFEAGVVYSNDLYAAYESHYEASAPERYLQIYQSGKDYIDMSSMNLVAGRLPESSGELAMSTSARMSFKANPSLGDTLTLPVGQLDITDSREPSGYHFTQTGTREFTIVGFYDGAYTDCSLTYHGFTVPDDGAHEWNVRVRLYKSNDYQQAMDNALVQAGLNTEELGYVSNRSLLLYDVQSLGDEPVMAVFTTCGLLILIILITMGLVVRNTFAISVDEKLQQYGTLLCLGANRRMIRSMVRSEALLMWLMAVPVGIGGALVAMQVLFMVIHSLSASMAMLKLCWTAWPFVLSLSVSLVCVLISASSPARACAKVSPIGAVRGEGALRNAVKRVRGGRILKHLLGFPGMMSARNMHRNPRKYRATLISVACSIALFMLMNGFASSMRDSMNLYGSMGGRDICLSTSQLRLEQQNVNPSDNISAMGAQLAALDCVDSVALYSSYSGSIELPDDKISEESKRIAQEYGLPVDRITVYSISREEFDALKFDGRAPSYEEFCKPGAAALFQQMISTSYSTGIHAMDMTTYSPGESLDVKLGESRQELSIVGVLSGLPWYIEYGGTLVAFVAEQSFDQSDDPYAYSYALLAKPGMQQQLSDKMGELEYTSQFASWSVSDTYSVMRENRALMQIIDIFLYGFTTVIVLICSMNLLNTIKTNISSRRREMSMLRAIGMSRRQMVKMLVLECVWYAVLGTILGLLIGIPLELMLMQSMASMLTMMFDVQLMFLQSLICLAVTCVIALAAGYGPIHSIVNRPATEGIRAIE